MALWVACQEESCDGRVFFLDTLNTIHIGQISGSNRDQSIEQVFSRDPNSQQLLYLEPMLIGEAMTRILRQRSVFIIGRPLLSEVNGIIEEVVIAKEDKAAILSDLAFLDTRHESLFQDLYGFAEANSAEASLGIGELDYRQMGNRYYQDGEFRQAVDSYTRSIERDTGDFEMYFLRGNAYAALGEHPSAISDYDQSTQREVSVFNPSILHMIYFNRANSKAELGDYDGALLDFRESVRWNDANLSAFYNLANVLYDLGRFEEALIEYRKAAEDKPSYAYFNMGNCHLFLGRFDEALRYYGKASSEGESHFGVEQNTLAVRLLSEVSHGRHIDVQLNDEQVGMKELMVVLQDGETPEYFSNRTPLLIGRAGNVGNFGGPGLSGGEGRSGERGILIRVRGNRSVRKV